MHRGHLLKIAVFCRHALAEVGSDAPNAGAWTRETSFAVYRLKSYGPDIRFSIHSGAYAQNAEATYSSVDTLDTLGVAALRPADGYVSSLGMGYRAAQAPAHDLHPERSEPPL